MAQASEIKAAVRARPGKGGARAIRREGRVPGVLYGDGRDAENIALDFKDLTLAIGRGKFLSTVHDLSLDGTNCRVIPREVQLDPVKDTPAACRFPARRARGAHSRQRAGALYQ